LKFLAAYAKTFKFIVAYIKTFLSQLILSI